MTKREGDIMIAVDMDIAPAVLRFEDILAKAEVVFDNSHPFTPWENSDVYDHEAIAETRVMGNTQDMQGRTWADGHHVIIVPADNDYGLYDHLRKRGASKQVAREAVAAQRRTTIRQLCSWYSDGWDWYGIRCELNILGDVYESSIWGFDSESYAEESLEETVYDVVDQLEKAGFTVINVPEPRQVLSAKHFTTIVSKERIREDWSLRSMTPEDWKATYKRNVNSQNWGA
jgi:hypothetical protein